MITRTDLRTAARQVLLRRRQQLDDFPTDEEIVAYFDGRLTDEAANRVREALVLYPELADGLEEAGDVETEADLELSDDDVETAWQEVRGRLIASEAQRRPHHAAETPSTPATAFGRRSRMRRFGQWLPLAAGVVLTVGGLFVLVRQEATAPQVVHPRLLPADGQRTGRGEQPPIDLGAAGGAHLVVAVVPQPQQFASYRIELVAAGGDAEESDLLWRSARVAPAADGTLAILIPARFLDPGIFRIRVYGEAPEPVASYTVRVTGG